MHGFSIGCPPIVHSNGFTRLRKVTCYMLMGEQFVQYIWLLENSMHTFSGNISSCMGSDIQVYKYTHACLLLKGGVAHTSV